MLWFLLKSSLLIFLFCLKACWIFLFWALLLATYAKLHGPRYQLCISDDNPVTQEMISTCLYQDDMVCMQWVLWSLMCTSNVAGHTQRLVSIGMRCKMGYEVINAMARSTQRCHRSYRPCLRLMVSKWLSGSYRWKIHGEDEWQWCSCQTIPKYPKHVRK